MRSFNESQHAVMSIKTYHNKKYSQLVTQVLSDYLFYYYLRVCLELKYDIYETIDFLWVAKILIVWENDLLGFGIVNEK